MGFRVAHWGFNKFSMRSGPPSATSDSLVVQHKSCLTHRSVMDFEPLNLERSPGRSAKEKDKRIEDDSQCRLGIYSTGMRGDSC